MTHKKKNSDEVSEREIRIKKTRCHWHWRRSTHFNKLPLSTWETTTINVSTLTGNQRKFIKTSWNLHTILIVMTSIYFQAYQKWLRYFFFAIFWMYHKLIWNSFSIDWKLLIIHNFQCIFYFKHNTKSIKCNRHIFFNQ